MNELKLSFLDHLIELRKRIIYSIIFIIIFSIVSYFFYVDIVNILIKNFDLKLYTYKITEAFLIKIKISVLGGIFFSIPFLLIQIIIFIFPALKKKEKIFLLFLLIIGFLLFLSGIWYSYKLIIPFAVKFLTSQSFYVLNVTPWLNFSEFIGFIYQFLIAFGISFELPIIIIILIKLNFIKKKTLIKNFRFVIVICFIFAAIITPPDWISQIMLALPLIILYLISIFICYIFNIGQA